MENSISKNTILIFIITILFIINLALAALTVNAKGIISIGSMAAGVGTLILTISLGYGAAILLKLSQSSILKVIYALIISLFIIATLQREHLWTVFSK